MSKRTVTPVRRISGALSLPGDKSISHRYAILAALADGRSQIGNYSPAADCQSTLDCLARLGVKSSVEKEDVMIEGVGLRGLRACRRKLDAGNSGTTLRLLSGVLAGQPFKSTITGDESLRRRPMRRIIEPLRLMGASIRARDGEFAPLEIQGTTLKPIEYTLPVASAQVKSALLLAGLFASGATTVIQPVRTRDHLELALAEFGAEITRTEAAIRIQPPPRLLSQQLAVPGDLSSAVFFLAAAMILPDSNLLLRGVGLNPTRAAVLDFFASLGATVRPLNVTLLRGEVIGDLEVSYSPLSGGTISGPLVAQLIDELPMLAALAPYTEKGIEIRDAGELRVKESDRIAALAENLRHMGAKVEEFPDGLRVGGREAGKLHGAEIHPRGDHRIAMAFAVAALAADGSSVIHDAECVSVSFPTFWEALGAVAAAAG